MLTSFAVFHRIPSAAVARRTAATNRLADLIARHCNLARSAWDGPA
jgi:hypothetical protein